MDYALRVADRFLGRLLDESVGYLRHVEAVYERHSHPELGVTLEFCDRDWAFTIDRGALGSWVLEDRGLREFERHVENRFNSLRIERQFERELAPYRRQIEELYRVMAPPLALQEARQQLEEAREGLMRGLFGPRRTYSFGMDLATSTIAEPNQVPTIDIAVLSRRVEIDQQHQQINADYGRMMGYLSRELEHDLRAQMFGDGTLFIRNGVIDDTLNPFADLVTPAKAEAKAERLLKEWLSPSQRAEYDKHKYFTVTGSSSGKTYRIRHGFQMNVDEVAADGKVAATYCFTPADVPAVGDIMLAQKIALECNEEAALAVANKRGPFFVGEVGSLAEVTEFRQLSRGQLSPLFRYVVADTAA